MGRFEKLLNRVLVLSYMFWFLNYVGAHLQSPVAEW